MHICRVDRSLWSVVLLVGSCQLCFHQYVMSVITWTKSPKNSVCRMTCKYRQYTVQFTLFWTVLKMEGTSYFVTLVTVYQSTRRYIPYSYISTVGTALDLANDHVFNVCQILTREAKDGNTFRPFLSLCYVSDGIVRGLHFVRRNLENYIT